MVRQVSSVAVTDRKAAPPIGTSVRKPSLTVTGALPPELVLAAAVVPDEADVDEEEEQAAASKAVAPIIAAAVTRRI